MAGGSGEEINGNGWAHGRPPDYDGTLPYGISAPDLADPRELDPRELDPDHESLTLGEIVRTLTAWAEANGGLDGPTLEVARDRSLEGALRIGMVHAANLVDVLSDYIHGRYFDYYSEDMRDNGSPRDAAGHIVLEEP